MKTHQRILTGIWLGMVLCARPALSQAASEARPDRPIVFDATRIFVVGDNGAQARAVGEAIVHDAFHNVTFFDGSVTELDVLWATSSRPSPQDL
jgi:hypothetical protein